MTSTEKMQRHTRNYFFLDFFRYALHRFCFISRGLDFERILTLKNL